MSLDLFKNEFSGDIPASLANLTSLKQLNLSFNQLVGPVPKGGIFSKLGLSSLEGNLALCGSKVNSTCSEKHGNFSKKGIVVLIVLAIISLLLLIMLAFLLIYLRINIKNKSSQQSGRLHEVFVFQTLKDTRSMT